MKRAFSALSTSNIFWLSDKTLTAESKFELFDAEEIVPAKTAEIGAVWHQATIETAIFGKPKRTVDEAVVRRWRGKQAPEIQQIAFIAEQRGLKVSQRRDFNS
ncbi:hypothetical protein B5K05_13380 [Rhizobium phaseoli]|uniref:hypothetical protein n=1 Tax=Rhizobium phaseoli TaxID=396 RepID=UPI000E0D78B2|nr:hypothetical protein [Rhizobium phaseoli]RDJ10119.1 hypothetical protein B5K04_13355 [Rhizobium phaseoli]RDJ14119.1 hypothetical protein B5K05_13380 [Rhizobium phaseoli]